MARLGEPVCYQCGQLIRQQTPEQILEDLLDLRDGTRTMILAPMVRGRKGQHHETFEAIRKAGFLRARVDGEVVDAHEPPELARQRPHNIEAVIDRVVIREGIRDRLAESIKLAIRHGEGAVLAAYEEKLPEKKAAGDKDSSGGGETPKTPGVWHDVLFSTLYACPFCKISYDEVEPRTFSFNSPYGACPKCEGLGVREEFDPDLVLPDRSLSLANGAIAPWKGRNGGRERKHQAALDEFMAAHGFKWNTPIEKLLAETIHQLLRGDGKKFPGVLILLEKEFATTTSESNQKRLAAFRGGVRCSECGGSRLRPEARSVRVGGKAIHEITALTVTEARAFFDQLRFDEEDEPIAQPILTEIVSRLRFLDNVGVEYLTLDRPADTLSGGELQRVRLATGLGSGLVGVCYILDEPSIGLHPRDNHRLIDTLRDLQDRGNTVLVVEHDEDNHSPGRLAGGHGPRGGPPRRANRRAGHARRSGPKSRLAHRTLSLRPRQDRRPPASTPRGQDPGDNVAGRHHEQSQKRHRVIPVGNARLRDRRKRLGQEFALERDARPGAGPTARRRRPEAGASRRLARRQSIDKVIQIDQSPIGRTPRSNPATYTGAFDEIRKVFANTRGAKQRGYNAGRFSFNVKGGRCPECQGQGQTKIEMNFLPDLYVTCPECHGKRFNHQTLQIRYRDKSIADVLDMRVDDAVGFFENFPMIARLLESLHEVGLGYLTLGQASTTLSGGEAQRVKLATELARVDTGKTVYILDEPTTGLHVDDIKKLLAVLSRLVDLGNTVIVIEHNLDVIKTADWIIDLGPEGGAAGGHVVATGTPEEIAALEDNHTGRYLREVLGRSGATVSSSE